MKKIIVIEKESLLRNTICKKLQKEGYETIESEDGFDAIKKITKFKPDMVITDIMIPTKTGFDVINFVKEDLKRNIPIIVISQMRSEADVLRAFELGATEYMTKPFLLNELVARVSKQFKN
jgi:DNA-binding response OmpR family regulator